MQPELAQGRVRAAERLGRRRAWVAGMRGAKPDLQTFDIHLRLDPGLVSLWDLTIDMEEADQSGHLLTARRVRLADLHLPQHGAGEFTVSMPTLGRGVVRRLRLYDSGGIVLDAADDVYLLERINFTIHTDAQNITTSIGDNSRPTLTGRLNALDRSVREHIEMLEAGVPNRVVASGDDGLSRLADRLASARGELLIYDPYFGKGDADWGLLSRVTVPVRVLTSVNISPAKAVAPLASQLRCRQWQETNLQRIPFHDRGYLWDGGGVSVGTSPNGLGGRLALIDWLEPAVVKEMTRRFESWWSDKCTRPTG